METRDRKVLSKTSEKLPVTFCRKEEEETVVPPLQLLMYRPTLKLEKDDQQIVIQQEKGRRNLSLLRL